MPLYFEIGRSVYTTLLTTCLSACQPARPSIHPSVNLSLSVCLTMCSTVCLPVCLTTALKYCALKSRGSQPLVVFEMALYYIHLLHIIKWGDTTYNACILHSFQPVIITAVIAAMYAPLPRLLTVTWVSKL